MEFLPEAIEKFVSKHTTAEPAVLAKLNKETWQKVTMPRMLAGHLQGRVLAMLSHMIKPKTVLEIGTYTGYSALCWAEGLAAGGTVHTIDINEELEDMVQRYVNEAGLTDRIHLHFGNAIDIIPTIARQFDVVFIDADKENYPHYYDLVIDRVAKGGYIIADNVLWSGNVVKPVAQQDLETRTLVSYCDKTHADPRVENVLFPIRDGLLVARKL